MFKRKVHGARMALVLFVVAFWTVVSVALLRAATPSPSWDRLVVEQDSVLVGASWPASCDLRGCADAYRITWGFQAGQGTSSTTPSGDNLRATAAAVVLLDTTITETRSSVRVPRPAVEVPSTVCLYVTAVRRGRASSVTSACRTVETPDGDPPPVDSITWDSVPPVEPLVSRLTLDSLSDTLAVLMSKWAWRHDSTGAVIDSVLVERQPRVRIRDPETGLILVPANDIVFRVGEAVALCAMIPHRYEADVAVISVPGVAFQRPSMVRRHQQMCAEALALDWPERTRIRWVSDARPGLPHPMPTDTLREEQLPPMPPMSRRSGA